jgi:hypothetical protein
MPSTYSTSLKLELIGNGEQTGTWGQTTNNNLGTLIEQAITGVGQLTLTGDTVLTNYNGLPDESRNAVLVFSGALAAPANVVAPSVEKTYIITNNSGANVTIKTTAGTGVVIPNGLNSLVYCDGTDFYTAVNVNNVIGNLTVSGNEIIGGAVYLGNSTVSGAAGNLTMTANASIIDMSTNTGAFIPPTGTNAQRPATPTVGMSRWNSDGGSYEIWNGLSWQTIASGAYSVNYLLVAGGGGATNSIGYGGAGAGGVITNTYTVNPGTTYTVVVGNGGSPGTNGSNSTVFSQIAIGGGTTAANGGSGGANGGSGTSGQGFAGGTGTSSDPGGNGSSAAGGGGAGAAGGNSTGVFTGGAGGAGVASSITGTSVTYAGGGGTSWYSPQGSGGGGAAGGSGGGGKGGTSQYQGVNGTANTGGGGGG